MVALDRLLHHHSTETVLVCLILISVLGTIAEVLLPARQARQLMFVDDLLALLFAIELALRFIVSQQPRRYLERYWIDLIAILPLPFLRVLRVLRIFRAAALVGRPGSPFRTRLNVRQELATTLLASLVLSIVAALVLRRNEPGLSDPDEAIWFSVFSLIAGEPVGANPTTYVGRWTTLLLMLGGTTVFGVFVATVSAGMVKRLIHGLEVRELSLDELVDHIVICGWNRAGSVLLQEIIGRRSAGDQYVVLVTEHPIPREQLSEASIQIERLYTHVGDWTRLDVLDTIRIRSAKKAILLADSTSPRSDEDCDARTVLAALTIERRAPNIHTVAELHNRQHEPLLRMAGVEDVIAGDLYAGLLLGTVQRNRGLVRVLEEILTASYGSEIATIDVPPDLAGRSVEVSVLSLLKSHRMALVGIVHQGQTEINPPPERDIPPDARLVVIRRGPAP